MDLQWLQIDISMTTSAGFCAFPAQMRNIIGVEIHTHIQSVVYFHTDFFVSFTTKHNSIVYFEVSKLILRRGYR